MASQSPPASGAGGSGICGAGIVVQVKNGGVLRTGTEDAVNLAGFLDSRIAEGETLPWVVRRQPMKANHQATLQRLIDMGYLKYAPPGRGAVEQQLLPSMKHGIIESDWGKHGVASDRRGYLVADLGLAGSGWHGAGLLGNKPYRGLYVGNGAAATFNTRLAGGRTRVVATAITGLTRDNSPINRAVWPLPIAVLPAPPLITAMCSNASRLQATWFPTMNGASPQPALITALSHRPLPSRCPGTAASGAGSVARPQGQTR
jgi:hypothetical protein